MASICRNSLHVISVILLQLATCLSFQHAAETTFQLTKSSIQPPFGNSLLLKVNGTGVQIYRCEKSSNGAGMMNYTHVGATAKLYSPYDNEKNVSVGYHYYLPHPLAQGAQPTFSFSMVEGDPVSAIPESTVTVNPIGTEKGKSEDDIDDLLLKGISHSGYGHASEVSYVQRRHSKGGVPPPYCEEDAKEIQVPYTAQYLFWSQDRSHDTAAIPSEISGYSKNSIPILGYYGEGYQHYRFNGSSWINFNVSALLYTSPGQQVVGRHYFLSQADDKGGQLAWEFSMPSGLGKVRVTFKLVSTVIVDQDSIPWTKLEATSYAADPPYM
ncbi:uncharacterized protein LOC131876546 [Cryptomeria japonica]|uniref:uncharacterized protein LOC131876546 n=1 Tax=Cryptomeria japonica TaxID=3369 RepID=UPI0027DA8ADD|nr:uncharacterized protein LOC131876546 [Cryptomeria japonica]